MYQLKSLEDTIIAISTSSGHGGIGIVRLSGAESLNIAGQMFVAKNKNISRVFESHRVYCGDIMDTTKNEVIDEVLLMTMHGPKSYTREDVVEISCHGGVTSLRAILNLGIKLGARMAEPGEFTKRAFLNGRIDLAQAEAVLDIIQSKTDTFRRISTHQLKGDLSIELERIRERLMGVYVELEAVINFPEDEVDVRKMDVIHERFHQMLQDVTRLLASGEQGRVFREGIKVVLCGKSNVGKSSLLNALLKSPRAIVSDIAGTTRDTIEETAQIKGIPFQLVDTAGILEPRDLIEEEAIKRSHLYIQEADLVLFVFDASAELAVEDENLIEAVKGGHVLAVLNKCDLAQKISEDKINSLAVWAGMLKVSALSRTGLEALEQAVVDMVWHGKKVDEQGILVSNVRHIDALKNCRGAMAKAQDILKAGMSLEFVSEEIKVAVNFLDSITGKNIDMDLLDTIFSKFCIGK